MKDKFNDIAEVRNNCSPFEPITYHNPFATFTTRGCPNKCRFCAVPVIEGDFREIKNFIPRPIVCDNNFLASSKKHFNNVIDKLKYFPYIDFNQGLEARLFTPEKADKFRELKHVKIRFSFDQVNYESYVVDAINLARKKGLKNISCYVLFGFKDTPEEALYKVNLLSKLKVSIYSMRYEPLDSIKKGLFINKEKGWSDYELRRFKSYWRGDTGKKGHITINGVFFNEFETRKEKSNINLGIIPSYKEKRKEIYKDG